MFLPGNNIFASDHGIAFHTYFYKTRAARFFMDLFGYIFSFELRLFNTNILCRTNVYELNVIPKYVRGLGSAIKASTEVVKPYCMDSGGSTITCNDSWGNKLLMNGSSY